MSGIQQGLMASLKAASGTTYATWDPSYKASDITLSSGNLKATDTADGSFSVTRSTISKSTGKWYWEVTINGGEPNINLGICNSSLGVNNNPTASNAYCYFASGNFFYNGSNLQTVASYTTGDVIGIAYNGTDGQISFYKNNTKQGTTITGVTGTWFAMWEAYRPPSAGTANFGATTMTYTAPTGFNQGLYN